MKKLLFSLTALAFSTVLFAQKKADDVAKFKAEIIDMGKLKQDVPATATFTVTNVGTEPLIIEQANPTCGCTIGDYTKEPIAPGKTGVIKATYNAKNLAAFSKNLTVKFAGVDEVKNITIKGEVLKPEDYAKIDPSADNSEKTSSAVTTETAVPAAITTETKMKTSGTETKTKTTVSSGGKKIKKTKTKATPKPTASLKTQK